jgi:hypothetical protein
MMTKALLMRLQQWWQQQSVGQVLGCLVTIPSIVSAQFNLVFVESAKHTSEHF